MKYLFFPVTPVKTINGWQIVKTEMPEVIEASSLDEAHRLVKEKRLVCLYTGQQVAVCPISEDQ